MAVEAAKNRIYKLTEEEKPEIPEFSTEFMDRSTDPFVNFFQFSNGKWVKEHEIPAEKSYWGASMELSEWNKYTLGKILQDSALGQWKGDTTRKIVGDFYRSAMDTETIERLRFKPIQSAMQKIESIGDKGKLFAVSAELQKIGIPIMLSMSSDPDDKNSDIYALRLSQGGLSLPNRDYYFDESFAEIREAYRKHITKIFKLYGLSEEDSKKHSSKVFEMETELARNCKSPVDLRDPEKNYKRIENSGIEQLAPGFDLRTFLSLSGISNIPYLIVGQPEFYQKLNKVVEAFTIENWKTYLKWKLLHFSSSFLHKDMEMETFDFYSRKLFGLQKLEKRWKIAVSVIDMCVGEALGKLYVEQEFGKESMEKVQTMVDDLKEVFEQRLKKLTWMTDETKEKALHKFSQFRSKIGHPTKYIDYSSIIILENDYFGNILRCNEFEYNREINRINKPVDRELWYMTPPTVNAYFSPPDNEIVFPAGILQPPFFDPSKDVAVNYGSMGGTIAHEITHGFDDEGRKYDSKGNLRDWWNGSDLKEFESRASKVTDLYGSTEVLPGLKVNGQLTLGENIADLGGVTIAFEALKRRLEREPELRKTIDGFTPEQRFFIGWSQSWKSKTRDEALKWLVSNDPHSPESVRGDLPVRVHPEFEKHFKEFSKKESTGLETIEIW